MQSVRTYQELALSKAPDEQRVVAVIDDFDTTLNVDDAKTQSVDKTDIGLTHGDLVTSIITSGNDDDNNKANDVTVKKYNAGSELKNADILAALEDIQTRINRGEQIDEINMSLSIPLAYEELGLTDLKNLTTAERESALAVLAQSGNEDLVEIINKISELSEKGVEIYISSGNEADDTQYSNKNTGLLLSKYKTGTTIQNDEELCKKGDDYYEYYSDIYSDIDINKDNIITEYEMFMAKSGDGYETNNDGVIDDMDLYNLNKSYDTNNDGRITGKELGVFNTLTLANGKNVHIISSTDSVYDDNATDGVADYANNNGLVDALYEGDVEISYVEQNKTTGEYGYDVDDDGKTDFWSNIQKMGSFLQTGTSFSSPLAAKENDSNLA